jgi:hypothetical protein
LACKAKVKEDVEEAAFVTRIVVLGSLGKEGPGLEKLRII